MDKSKCLNCIQYNNCKDSYASWIFFIIGLIATIAIRVVTVLAHVHPYYGKLAWYIGVTGFFIFFVYKYRINRNRARFIKENALMKKVSSKETLTDSDYKLIGSILCALNSRKETINYFFIFSLSALALLIAVYIDFIR